MRIKLPIVRHIGQLPLKIPKQSLHEDKCPHFLLIKIAFLFKHILHNLKFYS